MKHTPGPWTVKDYAGAGWQLTAKSDRVDQYRGKDGNLPIWYVPDHTAGILVEAGKEPQPLIGYEPWCQFPPKWWIEMMEANAKLIAAAPDMLNALQDAINTLECNCPANRCDGTCTYAIVKTAIEKATS